MTAKTMTVVRNGRVLDIKGHRAPPADILIAGDTIAEIGPPGLAAPADAVVVDATDRLIHPGLINAHTHGHGNLSKGMGDRLTLELLLTAAPWISGNRSAEDKYLDHLHWRARDADEGLHRLLRPDRGVPAADARGPRSLRQGLQRCRHARGGGAHGRQHLVLRGDPRPHGGAAGRVAEGGGAAAPRALRGEHRRHGAGAEGLALRPRPGTARRGAHHPAPLLRRVHAGLRALSRASTASACTAMCRNPRCR